jgi:hypothetical protein
VPVTDEDGAAKPSREEARALHAEQVDLEKAAEQHPALRAVQQMEEMRRVMLWYGKNGAEVVEIVKALNHDGLGTRFLMEPEVPLFDDGHLDYVTELGRRWHNYVASAEAVAEHMFHQFKDEQPADLRAEYKQKKADLLDPHDVVAFVARSRNIILHKGVFNTGVTWRFTQTSEHFEVNLRTEVLLNRYKTWWKQSPEARRYLESKAPSLSIEAVVTEHFEAVAPLYDWYEERVEEYYEPAIAEIERLTDRIREIEKRLEPLWVPVESMTFGPFVQNGPRLERASTRRPATKPKAKRKPRPLPKSKKKR